MDDPLLVQVIMQDLRLGHLRHTLPVITQHIGGIAVQNAFKKEQPFGRERKHGVAGETAKADGGEVRLVAIDALQSQ